MKKIIIVLAFLMFPFFSHAATYYWDFDQGSDANSCTTSGAGACKTFTATNPAGVLANLQTGDVVNLKGIFRPELVSTAVFNSFKGPVVSSKTGITIQGDSAVIGDNGVSHAAVLNSDWTDLSGNVYQTTIKDSLTGTTTLVGLNIAAVTVNYGQHRNDLAGNPTVYTGFLRKKTSLSAATSTPEAWFYNSGTGVLTINTGTDPRNHEVLLGMATNESGIKLVACTDCVVKDLRTFITGFASPSGGYGVLGQGSTNNTFENIRVEFGGYHGMGFVGNFDSGNTIRDSILTGAGNVTHTQTIFYAASDDNVIDALIENTDFIIYGPIDPAGVFHTGYNGITGSYTHTTPDVAGAPRVESYDVKSSTYSCVQDAAGTVVRGEAFSGADPLSMPTPGSADERTFGAYNIRHSDIEVYGCRWGGGSSGSAVNTPASAYPGALAAQRVRHYTTNIVNPYAAGTSWVGFGITSAISGNQKQSTLFCESCDFYFDLQAGGAFPIFFGASSDNSKKRFVLINNTIRDGTARDGVVFSNAVNSALANANANKFLIKGLVYYKDNTSTRNLFGFNTSETNASIQGLLDVTNNWYYSTGGTFRYANNTAASPNYVSQANFQAGIDPSGVFGVLPDFIDYTVSGESPVGGNLRTNLNVLLSPTPGNGLLFSPYAQNYGAWQYNFKRPVSARAAN